MRDASRGEELDLVVAGFGPSGIALAAAIEDLAEARGASPLGRTCFLEARTDSSWHREMLLAETDIQHHFLRDLATPRDPRSRFTFCNYLKEKGRLYEFGQLAFGAAGGAVSRAEWSDYLVWAADELRAYVRYGEALVGIRPLGGAGGSRSGALALVTSAGPVATRALVLATGRGPAVPVPFTDRLGPTIFHSSDFLRGVSELDPRRPWRFVVVGSGQSAVEILAFLHRSFPGSRLVSVHRTAGFRHVDLCQFSNEAFHPEHVDLFHSLDVAGRRRLLAELRSTNYGVVDPEAADVLYRRQYEDLVAGVRRLLLLRWCRVEEVVADGDGHRLRLEHLYTGRRTELDADVVVLCTGYREEAFPSPLRPLADVVLTDEAGGVRLGRDYRVMTSEELEAPIYLSGMSERSHGISDAASFSMVALRAQTLLDSLLAWSRARG